MSVPKNTTPRPFSSYQQQPQRLPDETPAWINDVRHQTPGLAKQGEIGRRAKLTYGLQQHKRIDDRLRVLTMEPCWDCDGKGVTGLYLYPCPICHIHYTAEQLREHGDRDTEWHTITFPCTPKGHTVPAPDVYSVSEKCPVCSDKKARNAEGESIYTGKKGFIWHKRSLDEFIPYLAQAIKDLIGLGGRTAPEVHALFGGSEPTAPSAPLEHPAVHPAVAPGTFTPHLPPLTPEEF